MAQMFQQTLKVPALRWFTPKEDNPNPEEQILYQQSQSLPTSAPKNSTLLKNRELKIPEYKILSKDF